MNQIHRIIFLSCLIFIFGKYSSAAAVKPDSVYFQVKDKVFFVDKEVEKNWLDANQYCRSKGLKLASIESQAETDEITKQLKQMDATGSFWTSGNDIGSDTYIWQSTGETFTYTNWEFYNPDHLVSKTGEVQHCVGIYTYANYKWFDEMCSYEYHVICNS